MTNFSNLVARSFYNLKIFMVEKMNSINSKKQIKNIAVFCGAHVGKHILYQQAAKELAQLFVKFKLNLIYGGAQVGLMGKLADSILEKNGQVIGVIPHSLAGVEIAHPNLTKLHIVHSMHARKKKMSELADGFILIPGGIGSLDEFFEIFTWQKLGFHQKPCGILNVNHYYDHLINFFDHSVQEGFLEAEYKNAIIMGNSPAELMDKFLI